MTEDRPGGPSEAQQPDRTRPDHPPIRTLYARVLLTLGEHVVVANRRGAPWFFLLGGHVRPGESVEETLHRVLRRTAGFPVRSLDFVGAIENIYLDGRSWHQINVIFAAAVPRYAEFGSRIDEIDLVSLPARELASVEFRPAHLHSVIAHWLTRRRPHWHGPEGVAAPE